MSSGYKKYNAEIMSALTLLVIASGAMASANASGFKPARAPTSGGASGGEVIAYQQYNNIIDQTPGNGMVCEDIPVRSGKTLTITGVSITGYATIKPTIALRIRNSGNSFSDLALPLEEHRTFDDGIKAWTHISSPMINLGSTPGTGESKDQSHIARICLSAPSGSSNASIRAWISGYLWDSAE